MVEHIPLALDALPFPDHVPKRQIEHPCRRLIARGAALGIDHIALGHVQTPRRVHTLNELCMAYPVELPLLGPSGSIPVRWNATGKGCSVCRVRAGLAG